MAEGGRPPWNKQVVEVPAVGEGQEPRTGGLRERMEGGVKQTYTGGVQDRIRKTQELRAVQVTNEIDWGAVEDNRDEQLRELLRDQGIAPDKIEEQVRRARIKRVMERKTGEHRVD